VKGRPNYRATATDASTIFKNTKKTFPAGFSPLKFLPWKAHPQ